MHAKHLGACRLAQVAVLALATAGCAGGSGSSGTEAMGSCPPAARAPQFSIGYTPREAVVDDALSLEELSKMGGLDYRHVALGATEAPLVMSSVFAYDLAPQQAGGVCAYATHVAFALAFPRRIIHIAREFRAETCVHDDVLAHERRHAALDDRLLGSASEALRADLPTRLANLNGAWGAGDAAAVRHLDQRIKAAAHDMLQELQASRAVAHKRQIDTPQEESRMRNACGGRLYDLDLF